MSTLPLLRARTKIDVTVVSITLALLAAAVLAWLLAPHAVVGIQSISLEKAIPTHFLGWQQLGTSAGTVGLTTDPGGEDPGKLVYDDSLLRSYQDGSGHFMMLAIAYDTVQREEDRIHRPEICYTAQGFRILQDDAVTISLAGTGLGLIEGRRMLAQKDNRLEAVTYWLRVGNVFTQNPWRSRIYVIQEGLRGRLQDGALVRVSQIIASPGEAAASYRQQDAFLESMLNSLTPDATHLLTGAAPQAVAGSRL